PTRRSSDLFDSCAHDYTEIVVVNLQDSQEIAYACVESLYLTSYIFTTYKSEKKQYSLTRIACVNVSKENLNNIQIISNAVFEARNFINEPVITLSSPVFAERISALFQGTAARVHVYDKSWI